MHKYFDGEAFIFTDYKVKFVVHPNYAMKVKGISGKETIRRINLITAGKVTDANEFKLSKYKKI